MKRIYCIRIRDRTKNIVIKYAFQKDNLYSIVEIRGSNEKLINSRAIGIFEMINRYQWLLFKDLETEDQWDIGRAIMNGKVVYESD